jgi:hypothetical protein
MIKVICINSEYNRFVLGEFYFLCEPPQNDLNLFKVRKDHLVYDVNNIYIGSVYEWQLWFKTISEIRDEKINSILDISF